LELPLHGWDLPRRRQDATIASEEVALLWGSGDPTAHKKAFDWQRAKGWYGRQVTVAADAPLQDRVLELLGRDPNWTAP
jgi:hypothetical protein